MNQESLPVLVACGQTVDRSSNANGLTPIEMMAEASRSALSDAGSDTLLHAIDTIAAVGLTVDAAQVKSPVSGLYKNVPHCVAKELGIAAKNYAYTETGGNTPQRLINHYADEIALGRVGTVLLTGGEALSTMSKRFNHWSKLLLPKGKWKDSSGGTPSRFGEAREGNTEYEGRYGMNLPAKVYPMFENALCAHYQGSQADHQRTMAELFSRFSKAAAHNKYAWFRQARSADELMTSSSENRMVGFPYTKWLNSMISVNQSAAVIMTSVKQAKALGIARDKWVFLHGGADANDIWNVSQRDNFHSSPAMGAAAQHALAMAGRSIDDMAMFDIYSCFPSAVQIACDEFGLAIDDSRGLTLTGGLPYFGGPGNNYSMHGIVEMMTRLRKQPEEFGLLNANGWYLTKHSVGVYSCQTPESEWQTSTMIEPKQSTVRLIEHANGAAAIETYTVVFDKSNQAKKAIVIGKLETGERFLATSDNSPETLTDLMKENSVARQGQVQSKNGVNIFSL